MQSLPHISTPWSHSPEDIATNLITTKNGLSPEEASTRLRTYGPNIVGKRAKSTTLRLLWNQCKNPLVFLLVIASALSFFLGKFNEGFFVLGAIVVNVALGFWQEYKADTAVQKLEQYLTQLARVIRGGVAQSVEAHEIVIGDYILFRAGDRIPADVRLTKAIHLEVDESILTGESLPVHKSLELMDIDTTLADRTNMLWGGTVITDGTAEGIVVATGDATALGEIATLVSRQEDERTPLERSVSQFATIVSIVLVGVGILIALIGLNNGYPLSEMLLTSIAVIVSAVPESLPIALSVVLAIGAETLARKHAVVRKMAATETLGATTVIHTDKTGTLTEGKLTLVSIDAPEGDRDSVLIDAMMNADVTLHDGVFQGRPLDVALAQTVHATPALVALQKERVVLERLAFTSTAKYSGALFSYNGTEHIALLGAPDVLLEKTTLTAEEKAAHHAHIAELSASGERVLGLVHMLVKKGDTIASAIAQNSFSLGGLLRFRDPIRASVPEAVARIGESGVRTIIVTGDHPGTAAWVAKEIGVAKEGDKALVGSDLAAMTDEALNEALKTTSVFARVTPEQKLRLVELLEKSGEVVAVTGDGVNDAPALKAATIGVAMGSGTDVARASSDIVVLDNNYGSIVDAIFEGRGVLKKIRTIITYLMADSFDELLLIGGSIVMAIALPISAIQILFVKFFADIFPTLAFTFEKIDSKSVARLDRKARLLDRTVGIFTLGRGIVSSSLLFGLYLYLLNTGTDPALVRTFIYASFASYMLFLAFSMRNLEESILSYNPFANHYLTLGVVVGFIMIAGSLYLPVMSNFLGTVPLPPVWFLGVILVGVVNFALIETFKYFLRKKPAQKVRA